MYSLWIKDSDGDDCWLASFDEPYMAQQIADGLKRAGYEAWMEDDR